MIRREQITSSLLASYASQALGQVIPFLAKFLLAWWIAPAEYGVYGWALTVFVVAAALRDFGVPYEMVRSREAPWGTAMLWECISGVALTAAIWLYCTAGAPGLAFSGRERLLEIMPWMALALVPDGLAMVARFYLDRELAIRVTVVPTAVRGIAFAGIAIGLAAAGWGLWSLVWAQLASTTLFALLLWRRMFARLGGLVWTLEGLPNLLARSAPLFAMWLTTVLIVYADHVVLGLLFNAAMVGFYFKAYEIAATLPEELFYPSIARVLYPALARSMEDPAALRRGYVTSSLGLLCLEGPVCFFLLFNADGIVRLVLNRGDHDWSGAIPFMQLLALLPLAKPFSRFGVEVMKVTGNDWRVVSAKVVNLVLLVGAGIALCRAYGPIGMAWANFLALGNVLIFMELRRFLGADLWPFARDLSKLYLVPLAILGGAALLVPAGLARLVVSAVLVPVAIAAAAWLVRSYFGNYSLAKGAAAP